MAKFTGFMCDMCQTAENGNDRPEHWLGVMLPVNGNGMRESRDLCSDKCLLKFARERVGTPEKKPGVHKGKSDPRLMEWLGEQGVKGQAMAGTIGNHVRRRHELVGVVDDCLVCQWMTTEKEAE